jgi:diaminopimelate decarboxylase
MPDPWPAHAVFGPDGLAVGGVPASALAERFGTPLLVFDEADVRGRMREARGAFPRVAYAVKAMTCAAVIRIALEEELDLLCASAGELASCLAAGAAPSRLLLHGNAKTDEELAFAVERRIAAVIVDDGEELRRLDAIARASGAVQPVLIRVLPEVAVETHEAIATGHGASKFGVGLTEAADVVREAMGSRGVRLIGLQAHAGSQVLDAGAYAAVLEVLVKVAADAGFAADVFDVGGGFGVTYVDEAPLGVAAIAAAIAAVPTSTAIQVEPGRSLVANPGLTLYRVLARKRAGGRSLVAVDGGMGDNLRPALYGARHAVRFAGPARRDAVERVTVVGRHCESGDVVAEGVDVPAGLERGDLLAVAATGAYTYPLATTYNRFGRPAVVGVRDGGATLWIRREEPADMDRLDAILGTAWTPPARVERPEGGAP